MGDWFVLYTKPKKERKIVADLLAIGINAYCPTIIETRQWSDRKKKVEVPLIPNYIFVQLPESERDAVFVVPGIIRYLFWLQKPAKVLDKEIAVLKGWISEDPFHVKLQQLKPGDTYTITEGCFKDKKGIVHEVNAHRLQIILDGLGIKITMQKASNGN